MNSRLFRIANCFEFTVIVNLEDCVPRLSSREIISFRHAKLALIFYSFQADLQWTSLLRQHLNLLHKQILPSYGYKADASRVNIWCQMFVLFVLPHQRSTVVNLGAKLFVTGRLTVFMKKVTGGSVIVCALLQIPCKLLMTFCSGGIRKWMFSSNFPFWASVSYKWIGKRKFDKIMWVGW